MKLPLDISSIERPRFPVAVSDRHSSEWYIRRRLIVCSLLLGITVGIFACNVIACIHP